MPKKQVGQFEKFEKSPTISSSAAKSPAVWLPGWPPSRYVIVSRQLDGSVNVVVSWVIVGDGEAMMTSILEIESSMCQIYREEGYCEHLVSRPKTLAPSN
jgi:hypothetical protein